ncbi:MAG TPA: ASPIC/UnbV domain-containing protein, partial [Vicinamibacterales bacterium]
RGAHLGIRVRLVGPATNPLAIGAELRVMTPRGGGPVREIRAGSGYWSMDAATTVLALPPDVNALRVRWPGGRVQSVPLAAGQRELTVIDR